MIDEENGGQTLEGSETTEQIQTQDHSIQCDEMLTAEQFSVKEVLLSSISFT